MPESYICANCGGTFDKIQDDDWNEEKAMAECKSYFGNLRPEELAIVCDDCFRKMDPATHPHEVERAVAEQIRQRSE